MKNLKAKAISGLIWSFTERVGFQIVQFAIGVILARLLLPEDFGVVAILAVFIAIVRICVDCGLGAALIQREDTSYTDECTVFWFNCLASLVFAAVLSLCAQPIANFFDQPIYEQMIPVVSLILIFGAIGNIQVNVLTRRIDFKRQAIINVCALVVSGSTGVWMALSNYGAWSLVGQSTMHAAITSILLWCLVDWRPKLIFSFESFNKMFPYGANLFISALIDAFFNNIYILLIGKLYSPAQLGYFSKAKNLQEIPVDNIYNILGRVAFPVFSRLQSDLVKFKDGFEKSTKILSFFCFPAMFGLAAVGSPFIQLLLTEKWLPAVPFLQLMCVAGALMPLHALNLSVLKSLGRSDLFLKLEIIKKVLIVLNILFTYRYGIEAMLVGAIVVSILSFYANTYYSGKLVGYGFFAQLFSISRCIFVAILMAAAVFSVTPTFVSSLFLVLLIKVVVGVFCYLGLSWIFNREPLENMVNIVRNR